MRLNYVLSFLVHGLTVGVLMFFGNHQEKNKSEVVEFQISSNPVRSSVKSKPARKSSGQVAGANNKEKIAGLLGLGPISVTKMYENKLTAENDFSGRNHELVRNSGLPMAEYDGVDMHEINFIKSMWNQVDKSIVNSPYLSEYGHVGKVQLHFALESDGSLIESSLTANAEDNILKVIAVRALRKALKNETKELVLPNKKIWMTMQFAWSDHETCRQIKGFGPGLLSFCNYAVDNRKSFSKLEKASSYIGALKYGFGAIDAIKEYNKEQDHRNTKFDPFAEFRRDPDWNLGA